MMLDMWGDPVQVKTTPAGNRVRVALGTGVGRDCWDRDDMWEMRVTHPDDDVCHMHAHQVAPDWPDYAAMTADPERFWADAEWQLMVLYDES